MKGAIDDFINTSILLRRGDEFGEEEGWGSGMEVGEERIMGLGECEEFREDG